VRTFLKVALIAAGSLLGIVCIALGAVYFVSGRHIAGHINGVGHTLAVADDSATIERGRHIVNSQGMCADCHGPDLGGGMMIDVPVVARIYAANLTSGEGGVATGRTDLDWERSIRHGVAPDGRKLIFMPSHEYTNLADDDVAAVIAYLKHLPKVDRPPVANTAGPIARVLYLKGDFELLPAELLDQQATHLAVAPTGRTHEAGEYVAHTCAGCHGKTFSGGPIPGAPPEMKPPANITPDGIGKYTEDDFVRLLREGKRPDGSMADTTYMPVRFTKNLSDDQIAAVWAFLKTVPPKPYGGR
jgi:cytochrome c553